jgi:hypothetical protein
LDFKNRLSTREAKFGNIAEAVVANPRDHGELFSKVSIEKFPSDRESGIPESGYCIVNGTCQTSAELLKDIPRVPVTHSIDLAPIITMIKIGEKALITWDESCELW